MSLKYESSLMYYIELSATYMPAFFFETVSEKKGGICRTDIGSGLFLKAVQIRFGSYCSLAWRSAQW